MISIGKALGINLLDTDWPCPVRILESLTIWREGTAMDSIKTCLLVTMFFLVACAPEVGSKAWCEKMGEKPKGDWTATEAGDFAKHCLLDLG